MYEFNQFINALGGGFGVGILIVCISVARFLWLVSKELARQAVK
jgi:hypothetical protein